MEGFDSVRFGVVDGVEFDGPVYMGEGLLHFERSQDGVHDAAVTATHVVAWVERDGFGGVVAARAEW